MGLSERKSKQRIGADPRNLAWKDDASRFGHAYLAKHGWDPTEGLGLSGQGKQDYIRVAHKLDALGIGAKVGGNEDRDGRAGREFERMLRRLNESLAGEEGLETPLEGAPSTPDESEDALVEQKVEIDTVVVAVEKIKRKKNRSKADSADPVDATDDLNQPDVSLVQSSTLSSVTETVSIPSPSPLPPRLAHRSRFLRMKSMVKSDSRAVSEILGISNSATPLLSETASPTSTIPSAFPTISTPASGTQTPVDTKDEMLKISTASVSVADYFKEKMRAKLGIKAEELREDVASSADAFAAPRGGLGFKTPLPTEPTATAAPPTPADSSADAAPLLPSSPRLREKPQKKRKAAELDESPIPPPSTPVPADSSTVPRKKKRRGNVPEDTALLDVDSALPAELKRKKKKEADREAFDALDLTPPDSKPPPKKKRKGAPAESPAARVIGEEAGEKAESAVAGQVVLERVGASEDRSNGQDETRKKKKKKRET